MEGHLEVWLVDAVSLDTYFAADLALLILNRNNKLCKTLFPNLFQGIIVVYVLILQNGGVRLDYTTSV
jgi:hypothetical protein